MSAAPTGPRPAEQGAGTGPAAGFRALHRERGAGDPLVLPGPWDAASARAFAAAGFPALATPSHGVATSLGHEDGATPAAEMFAAVARIVTAVEIPVSADIERGYGLPPREITERLRETGAVGCNLEDSVDGALVGAPEQADWLAEVRAADGDVFLNARIDSYIRPATSTSGDRLADALARGLLYAEAGADCLYPIGAPPEDLRVLAREWDLPVNALCAPDGSPKELGEAGASRVTFGGGLAQRALAAVDDLARELHARP